MLLDTATTPAALFAAFEATYVPGRYASEAEREERFAIFKENLLDIDRLSALNPHATFGVTRFSDRTDDEFASTRCAFRANATAHATLPRHTGVLDVDAATAFQNQSVDWRTKGAVTPVKDQGDCGGCWAFSSTGSIEGQWAIAGNTLVSVSEQELISCDDYFPCSGCSSGEQSCAWQFLKGEHGGQITTEKSYPYVSGATGGPVPKCSISGTSVGATISGYASIPSNEIQMSAWAAQHGPMSVAAYAIPWKQVCSVRGLER